MEQLSESPVQSQSDGPRLALFDPEATAKPDPVTPAETPAKGKRKSKAKGDLPLWLHPSGRWCRKLKWNGQWRTFYFGRDKDTALQKWADEKDDLLAGRTPRAKDDSRLTVAALCDQFLNAKRTLIASGELSPRTFADYHQTCTRLVAEFGGHMPVEDLTADEFERLRASLAETRGLVGIANAIRLTRIVFKYGYDVGKISQPVRFGPMFQCVKRQKIEKANAGKPARTFDAPALRKILKAADPVMESMVLLGVNCGFGQSDIASLPKAAVDLKSGWVEFPRVKTGAIRRIPLWPETVAALKRAIAARPAPKDEADADLVFITKYGRRWTRTSAKGGPIDGIAQEFARLLVTLKMKRPGLGFYALRHTTATVGSESCDQVAVNAIMGHRPKSDDMPSRYRHGISDDRLRKVSNHVRRWIFPAKKSAR